MLTLEQMQRLYIKSNILCEYNSNQIKEVSKNELGIDNLEFMIATNKNQGLARLSRVASGGEISIVGIKVEISVIKSYIFLKETLGFDESFWLLCNGELPVLKAIVKN